MAVAAVQTESDEVVVGKKAVEDCLIKAWSEQVFNANTTQWSEAVQREFPDAVPRADLEEEEAFLQPASTEEMKQVLCDLGKDSHTIGLELQVFVDNADVLAGRLASYVNRARDADTLTELTKMIITLIPKVEEEVQTPLANRPTSVSQAQYRITAKWAEQRMRRGLRMEGKAGIGPISEGSTAFRRTGLPSMCL